MASYELPLLRLRLFCDRCCLQIHQMTEFLQVLGCWLSLSGANESSARFQIAHSAPVNSGNLLDEIGLLAEKPAVQHILDGTYDYPRDWDTDTRRLMEGATAIFCHTAADDDVISTYVTTDEFRDWWLRADEDIQSSKSGCDDLSHYKAAAHNEYRSALHCAKFNLALHTGILLTHCGNSLTVLLEKEFGAIYIDKLPAICFFEADFNWLQKLIFAKRMMAQATDKGIVPAEQCVKACTNHNEGSVIKLLHNDIH